MLRIVGFEQSSITKQLQSCIWASYVFAINEDTGDSFLTSLLKYTQYVL